MDIIKKNWFSIVCAVVAILAIVAVPVFVSGQQKALQKALDARKKTYDDLTKLKSTPRNLPSVSIDPNAPPIPLSTFPGPATIEAGKTAITAVQTQSNEMEKTAIGMNQHTLLVAGSLPNPGQVAGSDSFSFGRAYLDELQKGIPNRLDATTPPSQADIDAAAAAERKKATDNAQKSAVTGLPLNPDALEHVIAAKTAELPELLQTQAATSHKMYMQPTALSIHPDFAANTGQQLDAERIWFAQLSLWVQQDVINAIIELNKQSKKVEDSPVKQLVGIETGFGSDIYTLPAAAAGAAAPMGQAAPSSVAANSPTDPLPKDIAISPTGHVSNGVFDVVHFTVCMHVQADDVNRVIQEIERGRFITALQSDVIAVNSLEEKQDGYLYGPHPVVTLTLKCESLFLRSWTRPLMPQPVKTLLNVQEPPAAPAQTASTN